MCVNNKNIVPVQRWVSSSSLGFTANSSSYTKGSFTFRQRDKHRQMYVYRYWSGFKIYEQVSISLSFSIEPHWRLPLKKKKKSYLITGHNSTANLTQYVVEWFASVEWELCLEMNINECLNVVYQNSLGVLCIHLLCSWYFCRNCILYFSN